MDKELGKKEKVKAFTLAEVLITLAIIGIVSALVIPSVLKNYNDKKYNTARLKALKTFGEAGKLASINGEINGQENARAFVENVLSKYLKITKVCDTAEECGFPSQIQPSNLEADKYVSDNIKSWKDINENILTYSNAKNNENLSVYINVADGFSAKMFYYPGCGKIFNSIHAFEHTCLNFIYDSNGIKAPNHVGQDIGFVTVFGVGTNVTSAAPGIIPYKKNIQLFNNGRQQWSKAKEFCVQLSTNMAQYSLPSIDELVSIMVNYNLTSIPFEHFYSGSAVSGEDNKVWYLYYPYAVLYPTNVTGGSSVWCVRR